MWFVRALAVLAGVFVAAPATAQQSIDQASVSGRVFDVSGMPVPGAVVTATRVETNASSTVTAGDDGRFRHAALPPGLYELRVEFDGFAPVLRRLTLLPGSAFDLELALEPAGLQASVVVTADTPLVETARTQSATTLTSAEVSALPLNGRQFLDLALLVPGVTPANIASTQLFPETSAVPGISLSVNGQRNLSNSVVVDGLSANDDAAGLSGMTYGVDAIEQVQVVTSGGQASLGRAMSGHVSIVTRSGTNALRGTLYDFVRDDALNARHPLTGEKLPMNQWQAGVSLGGPVMQDRLFYFGNIERRDLDQHGVTTISPANAAAINARLDETGYAGPRVTPGLYPSPVATTNALGKVDYRSSGGAQIGARYSFYDVGAVNSRGAGGLNAPSASSSLTNADHSLALTYSGLLGDRTLFEGRVLHATADLEAPPSDEVGPAVVIAGVATFGRSSSSPTARFNRMTQASVAVSRAVGAHALRAGAEVIVNDDRIGFPRSVRGAYSFPSLAAFLAGTYNTLGFTQTFGADAVSQSNPNAGLFVQDEWTPGGGVTLNLGVRYDVQWLDTVRADADNVAPRLGVTWAPTPSGRSLFRVNAGTYYDRVPLRAVANALLSAGNTTDVARLRQIVVALSPAQTGAPAFPDVLAAPVPSVTLPSLTTVDRGLQNARSRQLAVEFEQQIEAATVATAGYHYLRGRDLLMSINRNVPTCASSGGNNGCRPVPTYANHMEYSSAASSTYHALHLSLARRPAGWGHYRVSYTLAKSMNDVGEFFFSSPIDNFDLSKDWSRADSDRRHQFAAFASVTVPRGAGGAWPVRLARGFDASVMLLAYSAAPLNITSGVTTVQGTAGRPIADAAYIPRNAGVGSDVFSLNARLSRTVPIGNRVRLELMLEGFNLTNHMNAVARNGNFGAAPYPDSPAPGFRQITAVSDPRTFQVGARVRF